MATSDTISAAHKALKVKYHWLRERVQAGELALRKVDTTLQHADYLTKALPRKTFEAHVRYTMGDKENRNLPNERECTCMLLASLYMSTHEYL